MVVVVLGALLPIVVIIVIIIDVEGNKFGSYTVAQFLCVIRLFRLWLDGYQMMLMMLPVIGNPVAYHFRRWRWHVPSTTPLAHHWQQTRDAGARGTPTNVLQIIHGVRRTLDIFWREHDDDPNVARLVEADGHTYGGLQLDVGPAEQPLGLLTVRPYHLGGASHSLDDAGGEDVLLIQFEGGNATRSSH